MMQRVLAVLHARNLEFLRDRSAFGWNIVLPLLLVFGLAVIFSGGDRNQFKVAVLQQQEITAIDPARHPFLTTRYVQFIPITDEDKAVDKVSRHQLDMVLDLRGPLRYWINDDSPSGYVVERLLFQAGGSVIEKATVSGEAMRYVDWLLPGVLGMNMMFGCLFGVGYVVVRYRKNGFLKRLKATPLKPVEFIIAQVLSRLMLTIALTIFVYVGAAYFLQARMEGSYWSLLFVASLGCTALISLGLLVAARVTSEEFANGMLNMLTWPMMILSGVWFSLEGSPAWVQQLALIFPLTHLLTAARSIMLDGAGLLDVIPQVVALGLFTVIFLTLGAGFFKWRYA